MASATTTTSPDPSGSQNAPSSSATATPVRERVQGVINLIRVPQVPVTAFRLSVFNRWTAGVGQFRESVRLVAQRRLTERGDEALTRVSNLLGDKKAPAFARSTKTTFSWSASFRFAP